MIRSNFCPKKNHSGIHVWDEFGDFFVFLFCFVFVALGDEES